MRSLYLLTALLAAELVVLGQPDNGTLTISAARTQALMPPDQATFDVTVFSRFESGLDQVLAALPGTGITSADLTGVVGTSPGQELQWIFVVSAPFSKMADVAATLMALQKTIGQNNSGLGLRFDLSSIQVSQEARQSHPCSFSDLVTDARAQAQRLADAAGVGAGPILSLSDGGTSGTFVGAVAPRGRFSFNSVGLVDPLVGVPAIQFFNLGLLTTALPAPASCSMVVKFKLLAQQ